MRDDGRPDVCQLRTHDQCVLPYQDQDDRLPSNLLKVGILTLASYILSLCVTWGGSKILYQWKRSSCPRV